MVVNYCRNSLAADEVVRSIRAEGGTAMAVQADVAKVTPDTELNELIDTMLEAGVGALPVVDEDSDALLGIVSYVDVLRAVRDEAARA